MNTGQARIGVTGGFGFLGWHTSCRLFSLGVDVRRIGREQLGAAGALDGLDAVCHLAGVNRGDDAAIREGNLRAARELIEQLRGAKDGPRRVVYANSTQSGSVSPYGESKQQAGSELRRFCEANGIEFFEVFIPNVFGENGRPFYNSFVATFCRQLATGEECTVHEDREVRIVHAQRVARVLTDAALDGVSVPDDLGDTRTTVSSVLAKLQAMLATYESGILPDLDSDLDTDLFNTLRSFVFAERGPTIAFKRNVDQRGWLVETVKSHGGGQVFVSSTVPGITRGQHFHLRKVERFVVLQGSATVSMRRLFSSDIQNFLVTGDEPMAVEIPTLYTHLITNTGDDLLLTLFWSNELFDPEAPDTFGLPLEAGADR